MSDETLRRISADVNRLTTYQRSDPQSENGASSPHEERDSEAPASEPHAEAELLDAFRVVPLDRFVDVDEPSAEPLLGDEDDTILPAGGMLIFYGDGGAGKTTLVLDITLHLAAGHAWQRLPVPRPLHVLLIENEGPRGKFRVKLRNKRDAWDGPPLGDEDGPRLHVLEEPWGLFTFAEEVHRERLRAYLEEHEIDVIVAGPIQDLGMAGGGTPDEVGAFLETIKLTRARLGRPVAFVLAHHENKNGDIAGAWQGRPDTLAHVQAQGNGATRVFWRKVRWGSTLHGKPWKLLWREGESFELDDSPDVTDDDIAEAMLTAVRENPGGSWNTVEPLVTGKAERKRAVRDDLLTSVKLVNLGAGSRFALYAADDPVLRELRPDGDAPGTHSASGTGSNDEGAGASRVPPVKGTQGTGRTSEEPDELDASGSA